ncbi:FtsX-like permease family protein [Halocatena pleomorpha]|uniref:FtsX-like permease family protein n=1 Tax=Halocatena pleomorpha TaxID=1785090 RepID=A0A3P3R7M2_9EURY|nr:FtsX-like permease family protein [Halocatena pleomorpha]RRJ29462.1 FtsX-like permease family protein [Halocatena pleomorpha]
MSYTRALLTRWSRRDQLTVLIIAATVAFLIGAALLLSAASTQTAAIAGSDSSSMVVHQYNSTTSARQNATENDLVFPVSTVQYHGKSHTMVGVPTNTPPELSGHSVPWRNATIPTPPTNGIRGDVSTPSRQRLQTKTGSQVSVRVVPYETDDSIFPHAWYVASPSTVQTFGATGALVVRPNGSTERGQQLSQGGIVAPSLSMYFLRGMQQVLHVLFAATIAASVIILVVLYSMTKMSVRDRRKSIAVIRSTGGTARRLVGIFSLRSGILALVGFVLGVVLGFVAIRAIVKIAIFLGVSLSLDPTVTPAVARIFLMIGCCIVGIGTLAGALAAWSTVTQPPSRLNRPNGRSTTPTKRTSKFGIRVHPRLLPWRSVIPTATTLTVFALIIILSGSLAGVLAPLATTSTGTVTEPEAPYPMASRIDSQYAIPLRNQGIKASPEIIVAQVADGKPYLTRGANYSAFAGVSDAHLIEGHPPESPSQAVVGHDLARTLDITTGETMLVGGSTSPAVARVTVVGVYRAPGMLDDQLVFPLATAHTLSTKPGTVQFIRTSGGTPKIGAKNQKGSRTRDVVVTSVSAPRAAAINQQIPVTIGVQNIGASKQARTITASLGGDTTRKSVTLPSGGKTTVHANMSVPRSGNYTLTVGPHSQPVQVYRKPPLVLPITPQQAPPGAKIGVAVHTITEENVSDATITIGNATKTTNEEGFALVTLPETSGTYELTARKGKRTITRQIQIEQDASRRLIADIDLEPETGNVYTKPKAKIRTTNPWGKQLTRNMSVVTPFKTRERTQTFPAYNVSKATIPLDDGNSSNRIPPGRYTVKVISNDTVLATDTYTVTDDAQLGTTLQQNASFSSGSGLGQAVEVIFGNFQVLIGGMMVLAGLTTIGSTTATFAQGVHARRRAIGIYRATGATQWQLLKILLSDVVRISLPASIIATLCALGIMYAVSITGLLTIFGIQLSVSTNSVVLLGTIGGSLLLSCLSVSLAVLPFLTADPTALQQSTGQRRVTN